MYNISALYINLSGLGERESSVIFFATLEVSPGYSAVT